MTYHGTTILAVRHQGRTAVAGDGQVTLNASVIKHRAKKVRRIYNDKIIVGFAGATADALSLSERLQEKQRQDHRRIRRGHRRRPEPLGAAAGKARTVQRQSHPRGGRARPGLADRQVPAAARGRHGGGG